MSSSSLATVSPVARVAGRLSVPGDKSISHRYALVAAMADGRSTLYNYSSGEDCQSTLGCLRTLGVQVEIDPDRTVTIDGRGRRGFARPTGPLDAGNSGSTMRMLAGMLAAQPFATTLVGDASLSRRPMRRVIEPLTEMGAHIDATDGHAPLTIRGALLRAIAFVPAVPSAQVKSAVLLAGMYAEGRTSVTEPAATRDHTEQALRSFGVDVHVDGRTVAVVGGQAVHPQAVVVPGDFSSAAFWMVAAAALPGSAVELVDVGLNPTRTRLVDVLRRFGARVTTDVQHVAAGEPRGTIRVEAGDAGRVDIEPGEVAALIDELPAIAALAARHGEVHVRGAQELRVKESDRIGVLVRGFRALGIEADERPDGFVVRGRGKPSGGTADASGDHRMAMAFAVAALGANEPSHITGADAVAISYPDFFETLERLAA